MKLFNKLPGSVRSAPGLEWRILKKLPLAVLLGTVLPLVVSLTNHVFPPAGAAIEVEKYVVMVDILCIATVLTIWAAALTVAIGCFVVMVMKGHAYVADAYQLVDAEQPAQRRRDAVRRRNRRP
jgi:hypothetical protein